MVLVTDAKLPSFRQYFLTKGCATNHRRIVTHAHKRIIKAVSDWFNGQLSSGKRNLSISVPPRYGKTIIAGDAIEYSLGVWPDSEFIYTSYSGDLAVEQVRKIKETLESDWYRDLFPWMKKPTGKQKYFRTGYSGSVYGVGVGGTITGFGAGKKTRPGFGGGIVIDDAMKADEARSATVRQHVKDWYTGTLLSRRNNRTTPLLMIAQRLHPEDLVGHVLNNFADYWQSVKIPLIDAGTTETIWPEAYDYAEAMLLKEIDPFAYYSQYQQEPIIPGGSMIKEEWWRYWTDYPAIEKEIETKIVTADTAYGVKDANDHSVFQCWGMAGNHHMYLIDQVRGKWLWNDLVEVAKAFYTKHDDKGKHGDKPGVWRMYIENKASGQSLIQIRDFRTMGMNVFPWNAGEWGPVDKVGRVSESLVRIASGMVVLPDTEESDSWIDGFIHEANAFSMDNSQAEDDQIDAMTMAILIWRNMVRGTLPKEKKVYDE